MKANYQTEKRQFISLTEENGQRTAKNVKAWNKLLNKSGNGYQPIRSKAIRECTAWMLTNQYQSLMKETASNTSMFGPMNGLTGGALSTVDGYATGDFRLPKVLIPMVRRIFPALMANEVVGVQPMPGPVAMGFALRFTYEKGPNIPGDDSVRHIHTTPGAGRDPRGYESSGIKGIQTKYRYDNASKQLWLIDGQGYPTGQPVASVTPSALDPTKFEPVFNPLVEQIVGEITTYVAPDNPNATNVLAEAQKAVKDAFAGRETGYVAGMSQVDAPAGRLNPLNNELGYQNVDTRFTGRQDARLLKELAGGRWRFPIQDTGLAAQMQIYENSAAVARTSFHFAKRSVEAGSRKIATSWSLELEEDLKNTNGIDISNESITSLSYELQAEIDREMLVRMLWSCLSKDEYSVWNAQLADARWIAERGVAFYQNVQKVAARMAVRNRRGAANFIICTPDVSVLLSNLEAFVPFSIKSDVQTNAMAATTKAGTLGGGRYTVYVDYRTPVYDLSDYGNGYDTLFDNSVEAGVDQVRLPNYCLLGYKGAEVYDAGIIYCPYIPIVMQQANDPYTFSPNLGLMTRYGVLDNILGAELYYHCIIIDSFAQPGVTGGAEKYYPSGHIPANSALEGQAANFAYPVAVQ